MAVLIWDPVVESRFRAERETITDGNRDEIWEGTLVMAPLPNNEHQEIAYEIGLVFGDAVHRPGLGRVYQGVNLSDRADGWSHNYRGPDVVVYLAGNPAVNHGTHWQGGPDFLVEIISPGEDPHAKLDFYARVNTREVLIVHRTPWELELFRLTNGRLELVGRSDPAGGAVLASEVLPLTFRLVPGSPRPRVEVAHPATGRVWSA